MKKGGSNVMYVVRRGERSNVVCGNSKKIDFFTGHLFCISKLTLSITRPNSLKKFTHQSSSLYFIRIYFKVSSHRRTVSGKFMSKPIKAQW